jgi:DNA repair protein SbcC/Rad50
VLITHCYLSFFAVIEHAEMLADTYVRAQGEIARAQSSNEGKWPRDLNLILLLDSDTAPISATIRELVDDRFVCRKFVLSVNGREIRNVLTDLPFWPPGDLVRAMTPSVATGVQETVSGYDPRLIADLASHSPGAERISKKIQEASYHFDGGSLEDPSIQELAPTAVGHNKLAAVEITNFRGVRSLQRNKMSLASDVVFIYGPNGVGKTSIADAVEWAITGQIERLQKIPSQRPNPLINVFSNNGQATVTCHLSSGDYISRSYDGRKVLRSIHSESVSEDRALIDYVVGTKAAAPEVRLRIERLRDLFRGSHILSQHNIRRFLQETDPADRFDILTNMIGAEEFVRFREKVTAVLRYLRSDTDSAVDQSTSLKNELEEVSARNRARQDELKQLNLSITSGRTLQELNRQVMGGLKSTECEIDETIVQGGSAATVEGNSEMLAIQAEGAIQRKKAAVQDTILRLKSLQLEVPGYVESKAQCEHLTSTINRAKAQVETLHVEIQKQEQSRRDIQRELRDDKSKQAQAAGRVASLQWLEGSFRVYHADQQKRQQAEQSLLRQRQELGNSDAILTNLENTLVKTQTHLAEVQRTIVLKTNRDRIFSGILQRLPAAQAKWKEAVQLEDRGNQINSRLRELRQTAQLATSELNSSQAGLTELERLYGSEAARTNLLNSFLARLQELVQSPECPLCGRVFSSTEEAKTKIREHLSGVPTELRDLATHLAAAKTDLAKKQSVSDNLASEISVAESELQQNLAAIAIAKTVAAGFLNECSQMDVQLNQDNINAWGQALEQARNTYLSTGLREEAARIPNEIKSLTAQASERKGISDGLRLKLTELQEDIESLLSRERAFDTEIAARNIERSLIVPESQLDTQLSAAQEIAKRFNEAVFEKETELARVDSTITDCRENLRHTQEDIASKEVQLREYEGACSRFVAACHALGVTPVHPNDSIEGIIVNAEALLTALANLEHSVQILQQVVGILKLKREVDSLQQTEQGARKRLGAAKEKESHLNNWLSHMQKLESDVVRRQVDVVGAHLQRLEPALQQLYQRLNQHPVFGRLKIRVNEKKHELDVDAEPSIAHEQLGNIAVSPSAFFSDAQMNTLAISVFLAGALRQRWSGFSTIIIDDPIQQMDEMNVNAFLDLIRGLAGHRQFIILTCSRDFYLLALDKLECLNISKQGSFSAYRLEGVAPAELKVHCDAQ